MSLADAFARQGIIVKDSSIRGWLEFHSPLRIGRRTLLADAAFGAYSYLETGSEVVRATIGAYCSIGSDARVGLPRHNLEAVSTHPFIYRNHFAEHAPEYPQAAAFDDLKSNVTIGSDVWIGSDAIIVGQRPTRIGSGAVIAAGAVVTRDVEPYAIVAGNPARVVRRRFPDAVCEALLETQWWDFDLPRYGADNPHDAPSFETPQRFLDWWRDGGGERLRQAGVELAKRRRRLRETDGQWILRRWAGEGWVPEPFT